MRIIDADAFIAKLDHVPMVQDAIRKAMDTMPTIEQTEIIRCKDCKNNYNTCLNHGVNQPMCDFTDRKLKENDFCSRGERRE